MEAAAACLAFGGIAWARELTGVGVSRRSLEAAAQAGVLVRLHRGLYGHPSTDERVLHAARHGGRLACVDALRWHGLWVLPEAGFHVALAPDGHPVRHACGEHVLHHWD